jgi:hypothetical protein
VGAATQLPTSFLPAAPPLQVGVQNKLKDLVNVFGGKR